MASAGQRGHVSAAEPSAKPRKRHVKGRQEYLSPAARVGGQGLCCGRGAALVADERPALKARAERRDRASRRRLIGARGLRCRRAEQHRSGTRRRRPTTAPRRRAARCLTLIRRRPRRTERARSACRRRGAWRRPTSTWHLAIGHLLMRVEQAGIARPANQFGGLLARRQFREAREQLAEILGGLELGEDRLGAHAERRSARPSWRPAPSPGLSSPSAGSG